MKLSCVWFISPVQSLGFSVSICSECSDVGLVVSDSVLTGFLGVENQCLNFFSLYLLRPAHIYSVVANLV